MPASEEAVRRESTVVPGITHPSFPIPSSPFISPSPLGAFLANLSALCAFAVSIFPFRGRREAGDAVYVDGLRSAVHVYLAFRVGEEEAADRTERLLRDEDRDAPAAGEPLDPCREVYAVADHGGLDVP